MARKKEPKYKKMDLITKVVDMTTSGSLQSEIRHWLMTEGECKIDYVYQILNDAKPIIMDVLKDISKDKLEVTIIEMEKMLFEAKMSGDKKLALEIRKELNKIMGLHSQKVDIVTNGESINQISVLKLIEVKKDDEDGGSLENGTGI